MRVALDATPLRLTRAGTARYIESLLARLDELEPVAFGGAERAAVLARELWWYPFRLSTLGGADALHCPTYYAPLRPTLPTVVTVHDLAVLRHPEAFGRWTRSYVPHAIPHMVRAASRVIAVSQFTAGEVERLLRVPRERIRVVPNAAASVFAPGGERADGDYVLAVGTLEPRKNLDRAIEAAARAGVELRVVGAAGWGGVEARGAHVRWLGRVDDAELARLYRGAACLVYPSLYEGFGLPVLEALACGTPVVTSRGGATEEVAGGAAVLVDPLDVVSIADGIAAAASRADELRTLGLERARAFSWDDTAARTRAIYKEITR
ncbi:MAG TPA: glycosyltransferase family 1 protein [Gaiellaceae bacterium]|nr:glycosyltransferase family 1 protein [Gaiellaceae bacterium]